MLKAHSPQPAGAPQLAIILCCSIEASGDALLAQLITALKAQTPHQRWIGIGGPRSREAGLEVLVDPRSLAAHGLTEALGVLPATLKALRILKRRIATADALLLVDAPEINMRLLKRAKRHKVPVAYLAPPQAWAWRSHRAERLKQAVWVGCLFHFEAEWFQARGVQARAIGHPLACVTPFEHSRGPEMRAEMRAEMHSISKRPERRSTTIALFPGSRRSSVRRALPLMIEAVVRVQAIHPHPIKMTLALSRWLDRAWVERLITTEGHRSCDKSGLEWGLIELCPIELCPSPLSALQNADFALCHAGTVTLETALYGVPLITLAPLSPLSAWVASRWVHVDHIALPNLILNRRASPELHPDQCHVERLVDEITQLLSEGSRSAQRSAWTDLRRAVMTPQWAQIAQEIQREWSRESRT
jgi:lipid-A-disaccharide synthase